MGNLDVKNRNISISQVVEMTVYQVFKNAVLEQNIR